MQWHSLLKSIQDYLYKLLRCNRYDILSKLKSTLGIQVETESDNYENETDSINYTGK